MDTALITGMFNVGYSVAREPTKDVFTKKDSDFKDVLSKKMECKNDKDVKETEINKKDVKDLEDSDTDNKNSVESKNEEVNEKEVNKKEKKEDKKVTDDEKNRIDKINGLIERRLESVENIVDKLENVKLTNEGLERIQDELKNGLLQSVYEVGPQSVETEKITLDKFEMLEEKLDGLAEKLGLSKDESEKAFEDGAELSQESEFEGESDADFMSSVESDVLNLKDVKKEEVRNKDEKFNITDLRKNNTFDNNVEQIDADVLTIDKEIPSFEITDTNNIVINRAEKLQEQIDVLKQITEKVSVNILEDKSEMLIKLKPDNLGKVTMQIAVENGNVTAKFLAESERVKEILESSMQDLKDHLAKQGMVVQDLSVSVGNDNREREIFEQKNFRTSRRGRSIERIENNSYFSENGFYEPNEVNLVNFWPDSTVSFSA